MEERDQQSVDLLGSLEVAEVTALGDLFVSGTGDGCGDFDALRRRGQAVVTESDDGGRCLDRGEIGQSIVGSIPVGMAAGKRMNGV